MRLDPNAIYEKLITVGDEWAEAHEAAELYEETKKTLLSQLSTECEEKSSAAKESFALRHPEYIKHIRAMVVARKHANKAKVRYDSARVYSELIRSANANERAANKHAV